MRRGLLIGALLVLSGISAAEAWGSRTHLQGTFQMRGTITVADNVRGEHQGQHVVRTWIFFPHCSQGGCRRITLRRRRAQHKINVLVLTRRGPGLYAGRGRFWVALACGGQVSRRGGLALEKITVRVVQTQIVGGERFATAVQASYQNPVRKNMTSCPGGIGHDGARYSGVLTSALP